MRDARIDNPPTSLECEPLPNPTRNFHARSRSFSRRIQPAVQSRASPRSAVGRRQVELWGNGISHTRNLAFRSLPLVTQTANQKNWYLFHSPSLTRQRQPLTEETIDSRTYMYIINTVFKKGTWLVQMSSFRLLFSDHWRDTRMVQNYYWITRKILFCLDTSYSEKNSESSQQELNLWLSTHRLDALPLSYRRLVGAN